jgi:hypothetical protein
MIVPKRERVAQLRLFTFKLPLAYPELLKAEFSELGADCRVSGDKFIVSADQQSQTRAGRGE